MQMQVKHGLLTRVPTREKEGFSLRAKKLPLTARDFGHRAETRLRVPLELGR